MKKAIKIIFAVIFTLGIAVSALAVYAISVTAGYKLDKEKLINTEYGVEFCDALGREISVISGKNKTVALEELPEYVKNAFIAVEDKRFYSHNGIDKRAMLRAMVNNLKSFSFKEGASSISQQLIKNTHLTNEKTVKRKLAELKLTRKLEKSYKKDEILEMYLNTIYFGENSFGITSAANNYFDKKPADLTVEEAALLAGVIKAPTSYSPFKNAEKSLKRRNLVLYLMREQNFITCDEYERAINKPLSVTEEKRKNFTDFYLKYAKNEFDEILSFSPYNIKNCKVYTYLDAEKQQFLVENATDCDDYYYTAVLIDNKTCGISAYYSEKTDDNRQAGSTLKPLAVYAPAIEENIVTECTPILDEKTDFGGYSPANYGDVYRGYISVKDGLAHSSNVCAVKLLNYVGADNGLKFLKKCGIPVGENDANLALALGATENGITLKELTSAYTVFTNGGYYCEPAFIDKIEVSGSTVYERKGYKNRVYGEDTVEIMNYMLENVTKNGTAKKLGVLNKHIAAKTGTVGNENGNSDAYTVSYDCNRTLGIRLSGVLGNEITGGNLPANKSYNFWQKTDVIDKFEFDDKVEKIKLDRISYEADHKLVLADDNAPDRYVTEGFFKKGKMPKEKSSRFTNPKTEKPILSVNNNRISIQLCQTEYIFYKIYREIDGKKIMVYDTKGKTDRYEYTEQLKEKGKLYSYSVIPYTEFNGKQFTGQEITVGTVKYSTAIPDGWWDD